MYDPSLLMLFGLGACLVAAAFTAIVAVVGWGIGRPPSEKLLGDLFVWSVTGLIALVVGAWVIAFFAGYTDYLAIR